MDRGMLGERRLKSRAVVDAAVAGRTEILDRDRLGQLGRDRASTGSRQRRLERQVGEASAPGDGAARLRDQELVLGDQGVRGGKLVNLLVSHGKAPPGVARPAR